MIQQDLDRVMEVQKDLNRDMDKMQRDMEKMHGLTQQTLNDIQDRLPLKEAVRPPQLFEQIMAQRCLNHGCVCPPTATASGRASA